MKRILYVLVILCATVLSVPVMANAAMNTKQPKASSTMVMHNSKATTSKSNSKSATRHETTRHAKETHHAKKASKKG